MSRDAGDVNRRHYHVVRDGRAEGRAWQRWDQAWEEIAKRARLDQRRRLARPGLPAVRLPRPCHSLGVMSTDVVDRWGPHRNRVEVGHRPLYRLRSPAPRRASPPRGSTAHTGDRWLRADGKRIPYWIDWRLTRCAG